MHQVLYYSRGGNTRKVADAIAEELGAKATDVKKAAIDPAVGVIFLGSGCYGRKPGRDMMDFIESRDLGGRKVAVFGTSSGGLGEETSYMAEALKRKGASVIGRYYCKGQFLVVFGRGHPNAEDFAEAKKFARETVKNG